MIRILFLFSAALALAAPPRALVLGDSLARGAYATTPERAYAALIGATAPALPGRLEGAEQGWAAHGAAGWDLVVLEVGINDTLEPTMPEQEWARRYLALGRAIQASGARLVCVTPFDVGEQAEALARRADLVRRSCPGAVADVWLATRGRAELRAQAGEVAGTWPGGVALDGLHPNDAGHALIAKTIRSARHRVWVPLSTGGAPCSSPPCWP